MDPILKQRLVGATVLSAFAVILVPMLFDSPGNGLDAQDIEIPVMPPGIEQIRPEAPDEQSNVATPPRPAVPSTPVQKLATEETAPRQEKPEPLAAWVIQAGSFSKVENADQLRDQLRKAGFPAYVEAGTKNGAPLFRVRVGPELDPQRARAQREKIARKFKVNAIVVPRASGSDRSR